MLVQGVRLSGRRRRIGSFVVLLQFSACINYTSLYTPTFNLLKVPNTQVMNSRILNITHEGYIKFTFTVGFDYTVPNRVLKEKVINPAIDRFHEKYSEDQLRKPEAYLDTINRLEQAFLIRIFIPKGEARRLHVMQPELLDMIMEPGIDGLDTYRQILEQHPCQNAIITSGYSETNRVKKAQGLGAEIYLKKPYSLEKLGMAVKSELEK